MFKPTLVVTAVAAIALGSFDVRPAQAAPKAAPGIAKQNLADEFSGARKRRRGVNPALPLAAFGAIVGTIGAIAAAERRREYYERPYYGGPYVYDAPYAYSAPYAYAPRPHYHHGHHGFGGGLPYGYRGPVQQGDGAPNIGQSPTQAQGY